jgi:hypothetical protein
VALVRQESAVLKNSLTARGQHLRSAKPLSRWFIGTVPMMAR